MTLLGKLKDIHKPNWLKSQNHLLQGPITLQTWLEYARSLFFVKNMGRKGQENAIRAFEMFKKLDDIEVQNFFNIIDGAAGTPMSGFYRGKTYEEIFDNMVDMLPTEYLNLPDTFVFGLDQAEMDVLGEEFDRTSDNEYKQLLNAMMTHMDLGVSAIANPGDYLEEKEEVSAARKNFRKQVFEATKGGHRIKALAKESGKNMEASGIDLELLQKVMGGNIFGIVFKRDAILKYGIVEHTDNYVGALFDKLDIDSVKLLLGSSTLITDDIDVQNFKAIVNWSEEQKKGKNKKVDSSLFTIEKLVVRNLIYLSGDGPSYGVGNITVENLEFFMSGVSETEQRTPTGLLMHFFLEYLPKLFGILADLIMVMKDFYKKDSGASTGLKKGIADIGNLEFTLNTGEFSVKNVVSTETGRLFKSASGNNLVASIEEGKDAFKFEGDVEGGQFETELLKEDVDTPEIKLLKDYMAEGNIRKLHIRSSIAKNDYEVDSVVVDVEGFVLVGESLAVESMNFATKKGMAFNFGETSLTMPVELDFRLELAKGLNASNEKLSFKSLQIKGIRLPQIKSKGLKILDGKKEIVSFDKNREVSLNNIQLANIEYNYQDGIKVTRDTIFKMGEDGGEPAINIPGATSFVGEVLKWKNLKMDYVEGYGTDKNKLMVDTVVQVGQVTANKFEVGALKIESKVKNGLIFEESSLTLSLEIDMTNFNMDAYIRSLTTEKLIGKGMKLTIENVGVVDAYPEQEVTVDGLTLWDLSMNLKGGKLKVDPENVMGLKTGEVATPKLKAEILDKIKASTAIYAERVDYQREGLVMDEEGNVLKDAKGRPFSLKIYKPEISGEAKVLGVQLKELLSLFDPEGNPPLFNAKSFIVRTPHHKESEQTLVEKNNPNEAKMLYVLEDVRLSLNIDGDSSLEGDAVGTIEILETDKDWRVEEEKIVLENVFYVGSDKEQKPKKLDLSFLDEMSDKSRIYIQIGKRTLRIPIKKGKINLLDLRNEINDTLLGIARDQAIFGNNALRLFQRLDALEDWDWLDQPIPEWQRMLMENTGDSKNVADLRLKFLVDLERMLDQFVMLAVRDGIQGITVPPTDDLDFIPLVKTVNVDNNLVTLSDLIEYKLANPSSSNSNSSSQGELLNFEDIAGRALDSGIAIIDEEKAEMRNGEYISGAQILAEEIPLMLTRWFNMNTSIDIFIAGNNPLVYNGEKGVQTSFEKLIFTRDTKGENNIMLSNFAVQKKK